MYRTFFKVVYYCGLRKGEARALDWNDIDFNGRKKRTKHPSEKPLKLSERCIEIFSRPQDIVFVPFLGSGSELLACKNLNRVCIGSELDKCYFENYIKSLIEGE